MEEREYAVEVIFIYPGKWFVYAKSEDEAREFIEGKKHYKKCWKFPSRACTTLPDGKLDGEFAIVGWCFSMTSGWKDTIAEVVPSRKVLPVMKNESLSDKKCYEVVMVYERSGEFRVLAANENDARELVEKYCRLRNPIYRSSLPPDQVAWEFLRKNVKKTIGKIALID